MDIRIPVLINYHSYYTAPASAGGYDRRSTKSMILDMGINGNLSSYSRDSNLFTYNYYYINGLPEYTTISFILDSVGKKIRNLSYSYKKDIARGKALNGANFSSIDISFHGDSVISIGDSGISCMKNFLSANYIFQSQSVPGPAISGEDDILDSVETFDTASFKCLLTFKIIKPVNSVNIIQKENFLKISSVRSTKSINFTLPSSDHPQTLFIYDILGREAAREEISPGMAQYSLPSSKFRSGYYFARLGSLSGHFEVY